MNLEKFGKNINSFENFSREDIGKAVFYLHVENISLPKDKKSIKELMDRFSNFKKELYT